MPPKLPRSFFNRDADQVAPDLIGCILVHRTTAREFRARIVETEAYVGAHDLACHAAKGRTGRTEVMFGPPGHAYVYFIYGMYDMLNIVCAPPDNPQAVLIRAAEPLNFDSNLSGPGKLCREMKITRALNAADLLGPTLFLLPRESTPKIITSKRIGIDYAAEWRDALLRFHDPNSPHVSRKSPSR
jgi:DNA-3-methyladenine glycosylase